MKPEDSEPIGDAFWARLGARLLHPVQVQIIEALLWIDQPLSGGDLTRLFDDQLPWASLCHHIRRLTKLDAMEPAERATTRNITNIRYRLRQKPRDGR